MIYYQLKIPIVDNGQEIGWENYSDPIPSLSRAQELQRQLTLPTRIFRVEVIETMVE